MVASSTAAPPLVIDRLTKRYGPTTAVEDLSFTVPPGKVTGFLGPNGAGKTTTMRVLLGLASATSGRALIGNRRYVEVPDPPRTVGALVDGAEMHPARTGRKALLIRAAAAGVADTRVEEVLGMVGLVDAADRQVGGYSLGMRQRLGLAAALLGDPPVLVLDEPANGLDPEGIRWIREFLRYLADEVVVISRGRLVTHRPVWELTADGAVVQVRTPMADRLTGLLEAAGATLSVAGDGTLTVAGMAVEQVGAVAAREQIVLHELRVREADLEDAFLGLTAERTRGMAAATTTGQEVLR